MTLDHSISHLNGYSVRFSFCDHLKRKCKFYGKKLKLDIYYPFDIRETRLKLTVTQVIVAGSGQSVTKCGKCTHYGAFVVCQHTETEQPMSISLCNSYPYGKDLRTKIVFANGKGNITGQIITLEGVVGNKKKQKKKQKKKLLLYLWGSLVTLKAY